MITIFLFLLDKYFGAYNYISEKMITICFVVDMLVIAYVSFRVHVLVETYIFNHFILNK